MKLEFLVAKICLVVGLIAMAGCNTETVKKAEQAAKDAAMQAADSAKNAASEAASKAQSKLNESMNEALNSVRGVDGGAELVSSLRDLIGNAASTLTSVTDEATATAAVPEINKLTDSFGSLSETYNKLPDAAKQVLSQMLESAVGDLKPTIDKVLAIPGIENVIKPAIDALLEKMNSFKAA